MSKKSPKKIKSVSKESLDLTDENLDKLKNVFPEIFSEEKIDFEKLKILLGSEINDSVEKYNFTWAGKSNAFRNIQTTAKGTLIPDEKGSVDFDKTENLFVDGDNLEVLKLLQKSYQNKVKMIYIDPPYNTGKDFVYKDNFKDSIGNYEKLTGMVDEEGNRTDTNKETNGRFHSDWLTMMYPRLYLAKNLLKDDGVIFVSIDDHEVHNLRKIMDDIFGEENFVGDFIWEKHKAPKNDNKYISLNHESILMYAKSKEQTILNLLPRSEKNISSFANPDNDPRGKWISGPLLAPTYSSSAVFEIDGPENRKILPPKGKCWAFSKEKIKDLIKDNRIWFGKDGENVPRIKRFLNELSEGIGATSVLLHDDVGGTQRASNQLKKYFDDNKIFTFPKPVGLLNRFLQLSTNKESNDIILDFFAGSGTTAHAVLDLNKEDGGNRKFICVQLPEKTDEKSEAYKAGYKTISEISKERIRRVIKKIKEEDKEKAKNMDLGFKIFKLAKSNYKIWENYDGKDAKELLKQMELFKSPLISGYKKIDLIYEVLIKEGYDLNSKVEEVKEVKTNKVFKIDNGEKYFFICLDEKIKEQTIKDLKLGKEIMFVCLDESLDDNQKINLNLKINLRSI